MKIAFYICFIFLIEACLNRNDRQKIPALEGLYDTSRNETGIWKFHDSSGRITAEGKFSNGVRTGAWKYYLPGPDTIDWVSFTNSAESIRTNIPTFLNVTEQGDSLVIFDNKLGMKRMQVIISNGYFTGAMSLLDYRSRIKDILLSDGFLVLEIKSRLFELSNQAQYLYTFANVRRDSSDFTHLMMAGITPQGKLVEVIVRYDHALSERGRRVFFSIFPNLFIDSIKFCDSRDEFTYSVPIN